MNPTRRKSSLSVWRLWAVLASLTALAGFSPLAAQTLLLRYNFDEADNGAADAADSGAAPAAAGTLVGTRRIGTTPGAFSKGGIDTSGAATNNLKYVSGGDAAKLDGLETFTLTAWINVQDTPSGNRRIMAKQAANATFSGFSWNVNDPPEGVRSASNFGMRLFIGGEKGFQHDVNGPRVKVDADKKWVFVAVSYDGTLDTDNVNYYVGSVSEIVTNQVTTTIDAGKTVDSEARFTVSHTDAAIASNTALQGWIDDVRVYSGVLKAEQLNAIRLENLPSANPAKAVTIRDPKRSGTTASFTFQSQAARRHRIEYRNDWSTAMWQTLQTVTGTDQVVTIVDSNATPPARFYRVVTE